MSRERLKIRPLGGLAGGGPGGAGGGGGHGELHRNRPGTPHPAARGAGPGASLWLRHPGPSDPGALGRLFGAGEFLAVATSPAGEYGANGDYIQVFRRKEEGFAAAALLPRPFGAKTAWVQFFTFCGELYALSDQGYLRISDGGISTVDTPGFRAQAVEAYVPLVVTGASPAGGGTALEQVNRLTNRRRISYSADGSAAYRLPEEAVGVAAVQVSGESLDSPGSFDAESRVYTFRTPPAAGTDNVEITYLAASSDRARVLGMRCSETYNGDTDTRLFLYGDGSNTCIYSGVTQGGAPSAAYFPRHERDPGGRSRRPHHRASAPRGKPPGLQAGRDLVHCLQPPHPAGRNRHRRVLPAAAPQKPGELRPGSGGPGGELPPDRDPRRPVRLAAAGRGITGNERQARLASEPVASFLRGMDPRQAVALDDSGRGDYYLFHDGEALVHRYRLGVWCRYRGAAFQEVRFGVMCGGEPVFAGEEGVYTLDGAAAWDYLPEKTPIEGVWQSGPVELDRVRTVTRAGLLLRPESGSGLVLSLATDRRGAWGACPAGAGRLRYSQVDYGRWSYNPSPLPQRRFLRLRARKCTACRLTLRPRGPGCRGSVEEIWMEMT